MKGRIADLSPIADAYGSVWSWPLPPSNTWFLGPSHRIINI